MNPKERGQIWHNLLGCHREERPAQVQVSTLVFTGRLRPCRNGPGCAAPDRSAARIWPPWSTMPGNPVQPPPAASDPSIWPETCMPGDRHPCRLRRSSGPLFPVCRRNLAGNILWHPSSPPSRNIGLPSDPCTAFSGAVTCRERTGRSPDKHSVTPPSADRTLGKPRSLSAKSRRRTTCTTGC